MTPYDTRFLLVLTFLPLIFPFPLILGLDLTAIVVADAPTPITAGGGSTMPPPPLGFLGLLGLLAFVALYLFRYGCTLAGCKAVCGRSDYQSASNSSPHQEEKAAAYQVSLMCALIHSLTPTH